MHGLHTTNKTPPKPGRQIMCLNNLKDTWTIVVYKHDKRLTVNGKRLLNIKIDQFYVKIRKLQIKTNNYFDARRTNIFFKLYVRKNF